MLYCWEELLVTLESFYTAKKHRRGKNIEHLLRSKQTSCVWALVMCGINDKTPVKNVTGIFSCLFKGSLVENNTKSDGNPIIFVANAMEIP